MYKSKVKGIKHIAFENAYVAQNNPNGYRVIDMETATQEQLKWIYDVLYNGQPNSEVEKVAAKEEKK